MTSLRHYPTQRMRNAACVERPVPRSMLASRAFWLCGLLCALV